jgi:hypothetical protein
MVDTNTPTPAEVAALSSEATDIARYAKRLKLRAVDDGNGTHITISKHEARRIAAWLEDYERVQAWNDKHATLAFIHCHCDDCAPAHVELAARAKELGPAIVRVVEKEQP